MRMVQRRCKKEEARRKSWGKEGGRVGGRVEEGRGELESLCTATLSSRSMAAAGCPGLIGHVRELIIFYSDTYSCMPPGLSRDRPHPDLLDRED